MMFYSYLHHHLPVHGLKTRYQYLEVYCAWGKHHKREIESMAYFDESEVEVLSGPTAEFVAKWWKERGD